ncbi:MAG: 30S ribosomal protein S9 [Rickettsiaceae bacterium]|nr:30S ribosomal protein S9 [Rickettsiaceae bacterium]
MASLTIKNVEKVEAQEAEVKAVKAVKPEKDNLGRSYGTGRRKSSIARVWIKAGSGKVTVNGQDFAKYFARESHRKHLLQPFEVTKTLGQFDVICTVKGGGHTGQAGAIRLGIARAIDKFLPDLHVALRSNGMLTRDPRVVERKKYGQHKARKSTQFSKR